MGVCLGAISVRRGGLRFARVVFFKRAGRPFPLISQSSKSSGLLA